ncbi:MBL fold metallo-hydrolase [Labedaea rhizosphaerae]|uniref:Cyclase n=1 Tax=Labedaea rhizosphaerae TaxID=598644 RepID=A0A4R6RZQ5_LABRH|nr:MBL fold metallo-hydrolase [Labedaea rhizosphaerae]TDP91796.1 cyclase [Labedaea rhizosphaerae]
MTGQLVELAERVWAWVQPDGTWWVNNTGVIGGGEPADGTVLVDTCATEQRTRNLLDAVAAATGGTPVRCAVNTHAHGDHTYGNSLLAPETAIIGHERTRDALASDPIIDGCPPFWAPLPDWGGVTRRLPSVTVASELTVYTGDRRVEVRHPGHPAHTPGDLIAWLPDERVLFAGDLVFHGLTPLVLMGSIEGAMRALDWLAAFEPAVLVPGHGPVLPAAELPEVFAKIERYLRLVGDAARAGKAAGIGPLEAARATDLGEFAEWPDGERLVANLHRAYADLDGGEPDLVAALTDAMTYNEGPMHTAV